MEGFMQDKKTNGICGVCSGAIVQKIVRKFDPRTGPQVIGVDGPSDHQFKEVSEGFYCSQCGIKYEFVPPPAKKKKWFIFF